MRKPVCGRGSEGRNQRKSIAEPKARLYTADNYPDDLPSGNPFARVKFDPGESEKRPTFTTEERARILTLAR